MGEGRGKGKQITSIGRYNNRKCKNWKNNHVNRFYITFISL